MVSRRLFDRYVFVDWSASAKPARGRDSIWYASGAAGHTAAPNNPLTREAATVELRRLLRRATAEGERVLIGFDFPYGYPAGFAAALGVDPAAPPWLAVWSQLTRSMRDGATNANRRFEDAAELNRAIGSPPGPFWGHPAGFSDRDLTWNVNFPFVTRDGHGLRELRHTERHLRGIKRVAFPVWKLYGQGAVGSQALLGIPRVAALRDDPLLTDMTFVWPFETGFTLDMLPHTGPLVVHAEIWPGVLDPEGQPHEIADARQVLAMVEWARELDVRGEFADEFAAPPSLGAEQIAECVREEGWILGATTAAPRAGSAQSRGDAREMHAVKHVGQAGRGDATAHIEAFHQAGVISDVERDELTRRVTSQRDP